MSGFSPQWLALREGADHYARDAGLVSRAASLLQHNRETSIVDLGCGTGSNLRALAPKLGPAQSWTLVDYDERLLAAARERLEVWADRASQTSDGLLLERVGQRIVVRFRHADLNRDLDFALGEAPDMVTAAALFDLCSAAFIEQLVAAVTARGSVFYTALTFNGEQSWTPPHPADDQMLKAFIAHQQTDKGFGAAAGAEAPAALSGAFSALGWTVTEAASPWRLGTADQRLIGDLAAGFAGAVLETGRVAAGVVADWRAVSRTGAMVGHIDTLAVRQR